MSNDDITNIMTEKLTKSNLESLNRDEIYFKLEYGNYYIKAKIKSNRLYNPFNNVLWGCGCLGICQYLHIKDASIGNKVRCNRSHENCKQNMVIVENYWSAQEKLNNI